MPSWNDGDGSSSSDRLPDFLPMEYAPNTIEHPSFAGLAVGSGERCAVHQIEPVKCVSFGGANTGRRFYMCSVENHVDNCGFHDWVDKEWPEALQAALTKIWGMYHASNAGRVDDKIEHARFVEELSLEKSNLEKKHAILLADVKKYMDDTEQRMLKDNYKKIMSGAEDEIDNLKEQVAELKGVQKTQADIMRSQKEEWEAERAALNAEKAVLKEDKKKLEYAIFDLIKVPDLNKEKVKKIKAICEE